MIFQEYYWRNLPHKLPFGNKFFITTRLVDSVPQSIIQQFELEQKLAVKFIEENYLSPDERKIQIGKQWKRNFANFDKYLDNNAEGNHWLKQDEIAKIVSDTLHYWDKKRYDLVAFTIMSNHIHLVIDTWDTENYDETVTKIMQSIKRHTARQSNILLNREGQFWQHESYDHLIRNEREFKNIIHYTAQNSVEAGLVKDWRDYPYTFINENYF
jgi:REP element-mobilizing transposase RayT